MSDWAGIKKAINSNLSLPLNEKIDRDIEENRIGHGFVINSKPTSDFPVINTVGGADKYISGSITQRYIEKSGDYYYTFGISDYNNGFVTKDFDTFESLSSPYNVYICGRFVYKGVLYVFGSEDSYDGKNFYKVLNKKWTSLGSLPFSCIHESKRGVEYKDKAYFWNRTSSEAWCYDGSSWTKINIEGDPLGTTTDIYGEMFVYNNKLRLAVKRKFYCFDDSSNKFVIDNEISSFTSTADDRYNYENFYVTSNGILYMYFSNTEYELCEGSWIATNVSSRYLPTDASIIDGKIYYVSNYTIKMLNLDFYKDYEFCLPRNCLIFIEHRKKSWISPIENCEVLNDGLIRVLDDGVVKFRILGDRNSNLNVIFR